jgi:hypothetical protein
MSALPEWLIISNFLVFERLWNAKKEKRVNGTYGHFAAALGSLVAVVRLVRPTERAGGSKMYLFMKD